MAFLAIAQGVLTCLKGALSIVQAFKHESATVPLSSGHGRGFWDFYAFSTTSRKGVGFDKMDKYLREQLLEKRIKRISTPSKKYLDEITNEILEIADYESYQWEEAQFNVNSIGFTQNTGKMYFLVYTFTPKVKESTGQEYCYIETIRMEIENFRLAQDWLLVNKIKSSMLKGTSSLEFQYLPTGIDSSKIVDAVALAFAPVALGLVKVPENFLKLLGQAIQAQLEKQGDIPDIPSKGVSETMNLYEQMMQRQKERDQMAQDGLKEIGEGIGKITGDPEIKQTNSTDSTQDN